MGWQWTESKQSNMPPMPPGMYENGEKTGAKTPFFAKKYFTRHTPETFFQEYINFKIFCVLRHCGVIPVQSFGSHICPQPHGLGLRLDNYSFMVPFLCIPGRKKAQMTPRRPIVVYCRVGSYYTESSLSSIDRLGVIYDSQLHDNACLYNRPDQC